MGTPAHGRAAGALFFIGAAQFFVINTIEESVYPNYSVHTNFLSDLGAYQPTAMFWNPSLFTLGVLSVLGSYALLRSTGRRGLLVPFFIGSAGPILVAIFPENTILAIHLVGAFTSFVFGGISAILTYRLTRPPFRYFAAVLGGVTLVAVPLFALGYDLGLGAGGMERTIAYPILLWYFSFGGYLMASG